MTKYHRLGGLNDRNLFSPSSGVWKSEVLSRLISAEPPLLGFQMVIFSSLCLHMIFLLCLCLNLLF